MKTFGKEQTKYTYCARNKKEEINQTHFTKRQNYHQLLSPSMDITSEKKKTKTKTDLEKSP